MANATRPKPVGKPRVFISYTWRTPGMKQRALKFAEKLRKAGIDVRIDLFYYKSLHGFTPPDPLPNRDAWEAWQEEQIRDADCVLLICSTEYPQSAIDTGVWRDIQFMNRKISAGAKLRHFIPIGFATYGANQPNIPAFIQGAYYYDVSPGEASEFDDLVRRLKTEFPQAVQSTTESPMNAKARVFVSHSSNDKPFVRKLVEELKTHHLDVWFDEQEIKAGDSIVAKISTGLSDFDYLVVVLSKASVASRWVQEELNTALMDQFSGKGGVVLPVLIENCDIPPLLKSRLYADFRTSFAAGMQKLLAVFEQESESAAQLQFGTAFTTGAPCSSALGALRLADLRRRITNRMNRGEVSVIWFGVFETQMDDDMAGRPLSNCVIELLDKAKKQNKLADVISEVCAERPDIASP